MVLWSPLTKCKHTTDSRGNSMFILHKEHGNEENRILYYVTSCAVHIHKNGGLFIFGFTDLDAYNIDQFFPELLSDHSRDIWSDLVMLDTLIQKSMGTYQKTNVYGEHIFKVLDTAELDAYRRIDKRLREPSS